VDDAGTERLLIEELPEDEAAAGQRRRRVAVRRQRARKSGAIGGGDEQIRIVARPKMRRRIQRVREVRAFDEDRCEAGVRERRQQTAQLLVESGVADRRCAHTFDQARA
jgi:hypothetical protein